MNELKVGESEKQQIPHSCWIDFTQVLICILYMSVYMLQYNQRATFENENHA